MDERKRRAMRIGTGYDVHRLVEGRKLILGGVEIPFSLGLLGHSDADVLCHAVTDAILGAVAMEDIGTHFPDTDESYRGADSLKLLREAYRRVRERGYRLSNIDATILMQKPKLRPYIDRMRENLAEALEIDADRVSVKATTEEGLGFSGRSEGVSVQAVALLMEKQELPHSDR